MDFGTNAGRWKITGAILDLDTAIATVSYTANGVHFKREIFSSAADQVIVIRLTADKPGQISFIGTMQTPQQAVTGTAGSNTLVLHGVNGEAQGVKGVLKFEARVKVLAENAKDVNCGDLITVSGADSVTLIAAAANELQKLPGCQQRSRSHRQKTN